MARQRRGIGSDRSTSLSPPTERNRQTPNTNDDREVWTIRGIPVLFLIMFVGWIQTHKGHSGTKAVITSGSSSSIPLGERPKMHTFFDYTKMGANSTIDKNEIFLLKEWTNAWKASGWEPIVLSMKDAKQHDDFDYITARLDQVPMQKRNPDGSISPNRLHFYRWVAMAAVGGGWICDYDVFPLNYPAVLSTDIKLLEQFTIYHSYMAQYTDTPIDVGKPTLMSGSQGEWNRMVNRLLENGLQQDGINTDHISHWNDAMALASLQIEAAKIVVSKKQKFSSKISPFYVLKDEVISAKLLLIGDTPWDCKSLQTKRAFRISHNAIRQASVIQPEAILEHADHRIRLAEKLMFQFHHLCKVEHPPFAEYLYG
jgi:hypothetical protein